MKKRTDEHLENVHDGEVTEYSEGLARDNVDVEGYEKALNRAKEDFRIYKES